MLLHNTAIHGSKDSIISSDPYFKSKVVAVIMEAMNRDVKAWGVEGELENVNRKETKQKGGGMHQIPSNE